VRCGVDFLFHQEKCGLEVESKVMFNSIKEINNILIVQGENPAKFKRHLYGITKTSIQNDSFISDAVVKVLIKNT
jgi:hypothetical protein